jgi:hypothetical protein
MRRWITGIVVAAILQLLNDPRFEAWLRKALQQLEADIFAEIGRGNGSLVTLIKAVPMLVLGELRKIIPLEERRLVQHPEEFPFDPYEAHMRGNELFDQGIYQTKHRPKPVQPGDLPPGTHKGEGPGHAGGD